MTRLGQMIWEDGVKKGEERGEAKGKATAYIEMIHDGFISIIDAAVRLGITEEDLEKLLNNSN